MFDVHQIIDSIIEEQYGMFKGLVSGNYSAFCTFFADIMGKLAALREGVKKDEEAKNAQIEDLKAQIKRLHDLEVEDGGRIEGGETKSFDYNLFDGE